MFVEPARGWRERLVREDNIRESPRHGLIKCCVPAAFDDARRCRHLIRIDVDLDAGLEVSRNLAWNRLRDCPMP